MACVKGFSWGMPQDQIVKEIGSVLAIQSLEGGVERLVAEDVRLDQLPTQKVILSLHPQQGLQSLAYEFNPEDMTEVLAGLRARLGSPLSTSREEHDLQEQLWVWNTGEDLITAIRRSQGERHQFIIAYRPSRLNPSQL